MPLRSALLALSLAAAGLTACGNGNAPSDHTVSEDGVKHKSGLQDPLTNCVACHGATLTGGQGPSCFSCHGKKW
jgi:mono/diheme cytochrome c family protein